MEDFQNILVTIGPPLSDYIQNSPYIGDNVVFLVNYNGKYYALPSWYAGESNGNYYFFINLLNIPSLYNSNNGCNIISIFIGFSNENLLPYLNGTIGGSPEALDPNNPSNAIIYDNGLNVFPIYVNFYPYPGSGGAYLIEDNQSCSNSNGYPACYQNSNILLQQNNVLPPYNNVSIYVNGTYSNGTEFIPNVVTNGPLQGLLMDNGQNQGSYALITSNVLQNTFSQLPQSQNGLGLQTFAYFSGIPWEDSPSTGINPRVADAVVLSYVSYNNNGPFPAYTISYYNGYDSKHNRVPGPRGSYHIIGNQNIGINVGGYTYLPLNFPIFMYEYGWTSGGPGPGSSSGYYVGILQYNNTQGLGYFLTTQYTNNPNLGYYDYYYSGSGWSTSSCWKFPPICYNLNYYFLEDNNGKIQGQNGGSNYFAFIPLDQQQNQNYNQYGVFWLYNWFQAENNNNMNIMNIYFLMNGNIYGTSLASPEEYSFGGENEHPILPNPPASIFAQSYINAYNTAFNQETSSFNENYQKALNEYSAFTYEDVNSNFMLGTFGYDEQYNDLQSGTFFTINYLQDDLNDYTSGTPYLFISAGSGGGSGFMYLDWVIVTYGVPYIVSVS